MLAGATRALALQGTCAAARTQPTRRLNAHAGQVVDFYEFYEGLQEGWDGPALLVFSDGDRVGARLDRNGLRPARYWLTDDDLVYVASEARARPAPSMGRALGRTCRQRRLAQATSR
jgi:glutamate synthase domain-containing protein 1